MYRSCLYCSKLLCEFCYTLHLQSPCISLFFVFFLHHQCLCCIFQILLWNLNSRSLPPMCSHMSTYILARMQSPMLSFSARIVTHITSLIANSDNSHPQPHTSISPRHITSKNWNCISLLLQDIRQGARHAIVSNVISSLHREVLVCRTDIFLHSSTDSL